MAVTQFNTNQLQDNILSADATGRGKLQDGFFSADATGRAKLANSVIDTAQLNAAAVTDAKLDAATVLIRESELLLDDSVATPTASAAKGFVDGTGAEGAVTERVVADSQVRVQTGGTAYNHQGKRLVFSAVDPVPGYTATAPGAGNTRHDIAVITSGAVFAVRVGTAAASGSQADPTLTAGDVPVARIVLVGIDATVNTADLTDLRERNHIRGSKLLNTSIDNTKLAAGILSADATGRALIASGFFDAATVTAKFAASSIALDRLAEAVIQADGGQAFTADQSMGGFKITSLGAPTAAGDAARKQDVDDARTGLDAKASVRVATTANITLSAAQTIDAVSAVAGDRVLVKDQTTASENGIYVVAAGAWTRATDADTSTEVTSGMFTFVEEGTANGDTGWLLSTNAPITLGTTGLAFVQFSAAGTIQAGAGLTKTGNTIDVVAADTSLTVNADSVQVKLDTAGAIGLDGGGAGLEVKVDADTMQIVANAIDVKRDPAGAVGETAATGIKVNVDAVGIEIAANALQLKDAGVVFAKLATAVSNRLGRYDRHERFTGSTVTTIALAVADAELGTDGTPTGGHQAFKNGQLLSSGAGNDYTTSSNTLILATRLTTDVIDLFYKRTGALI